MCVPNTRAGCGLNRPAWPRTPSPAPPGLAYSSAAELQAESPHGEGNAARRPAAEVSGKETEKRLDRSRAPREPRTQHGSGRKEQKG